MLSHSPLCKYVTLKPVYLRTYGGDSYDIQVVSAAVAWVGIGFPTDGFEMVPSDAVIGLPDDEEVFEYNMTARVGARLRP